MRVYCFFVTFLVCFLIGCSTSSKPVEKKSYTPAPIISATELFNAVRDNREQAIIDYNGKEYSITGRTDSIYTNPNDIPFVPLDTGTYRTVDCYFKKNQKKMLVKNLYEGYSNVTIQGKIQIHEGLNPKITVENCKVITWNKGSKSYSPSSPSYSKVVANVGESIVLDSNGSLVYIAVSKEAFEEKLLYIHANDNKGFQNLLKSGNFFAVDSGTKAKVIDKLPGFASLGRRVRITHGEYSGMDGWVGIENCKK